MSAESSTAFSPPVDYLLRELARVKRENARMRRDNRELRKQRDRWREIARNAEWAAVHAASPYYARKLR